MVLLACFDVFLYRYSNHDDIVVGTPIANRHYQELEGLIGFFVNTLVLRTSCQGDKDFIHLLKQVRQCALEAYSHQDIPFEQLVDHLKITRDLSRHPIFQVLFDFQDIGPTGEENWLNTKAALIPSHYVEAKFDLTLDAVETLQGLSFNFQYATDLFDRSTIVRMAGHFTQLITSIIQAPEQAIATLPLLSEAELHQQLVEWNATQRPYPVDQTLHGLFEAQVECTPEATAVVFEGQSLTYEELNAKANQLAHYLRDLGVGSEILVGISLDRSLEMIIGLLGILKAGGAYVPLDPDYPRARLDYMLKDSQCAVLLTQAAYKERYAEYQGHLLAMEDIMATLANDYPSCNLVPLATATNLAYVIYTSGSTGQPKGVMIEHRSLLNYTLWVKHYLNTDKGCGSILHGTLCFDLPVTAIYSTLVSGKALYLASNLTGNEGLKQALESNCKGFC